MNEYIEESSAEREHQLDRILVGETFLNKGIENLDKAIAASGQIVDENERELLLEYIKPVIKELFLNYIRIPKEF